ncbi:uncharacterized protein LOC130936534 [Arachis stenosperma]|uniref:uncharacterized protein LOC130936534 n=1 Tax=Arachis stenosperma TaxID=217475 RepID=UPI0025AD4D86|nr:uncharacterized protein LOC130936534 [Arachis stenosperma]
MRFAEFQNSIIQKLGLQGVKRVKKLFYRIPIPVLRDDVKYDSFVIGSDDNLEVLFNCRRQFPEVRTPKLLAKFVDVVSSSGGSNRNLQALATVACYSSRPVSASSSVPVIVPQEMVVASLSFAADLNSSGDREGGTPDGIDDVLPDDDDADDVEPDIIADDSGDDKAANNPTRVGGASSSGTQQYHLYFLYLDLDVMRQEGIPGKPDKEEVVFSVKTYSIRRGVQHKVLESDYRKYFGKCKEFGNGCTCLIRISLRPCRGIWEVKRYNGLHTFLATLISSDHSSLDYHVISAFILPMVRADAAMGSRHC